MLATPTLSKLNDAVRPVCPPLMEGLEQRRMLAVDIQFAGPADVNEGSEAGYNFAYSGLPQGATFTGWQIDWGDGSSPSGSSDPSPFLGHTYRDGESYATLCATLDYQDQSSYDHSYTESFYVHVNNIAPTLDVSADDSCQESSAVNVYVSATDPGEDSVYQWHIDWGDGATSQILARSGMSAHVYPDGDNSYSINLVAYDDDGTYTAGPFDAFCGNVAPSLSISASAGSVPEGSEVSLSTSAWDPGDDTIQGWIIDWGDGSGAETYYGGPSSAFSHFYADADASGNTFGISAQAWDEDGTYSGGSAEVIVGNVAPSITLDTNVEDGTLYDGDLTLGMSHTTDPGDDTIYQWVIDWGDGTDDTLSGDPNSATHQYASDGDYNVAATAYDEDGNYSAAIDVAVQVLTARVACTIPQGNTRATFNADTQTFTLKADNLLLETVPFTITITDAQGNPKQGVQITIALRSAQPQGQTQASFAREGTSNAQGIVENSMSYNSTMLSGQYSYNIKVGDTVIGVFNVVITR